jgi:hypothetical protein
MKAVISKGRGELSQTEERQRGERGRKEGRKEVKYVVVSDE